MIWIIIGLALALVVGPVVYLMPTRKDRRLAAMRMTARRLGMRVELKPVRKLGATADERVSSGGKARAPVHRSVAYRLPLRRTLKHLGSWRLLRSPCDDGWVFDAGLPQPPSTDFLPALLPLLAPLPGDSVAVEGGIREISCYWLERFPADDETVAALKESLAALGEHLLARDAEIADRPLLL